MVLSTNERNKKRSKLMETYFVHRRLNIVKISTLPKLITSLM